MSHTDGDEVVEETAPAAAAAAPAAHARANQRADGGETPPLIAPPLDWERALHHAFELLPPGLSKEDVLCFVSKKFDERQQSEFASGGKRKRDAVPVDPSVPLDDAEEGHGADVEADDDDTAAAENDAEPEDGALGKSAKKAKAAKKSDDDSDDEWEGSEGAKGSEDSESESESEGEGESVPVAAAKAVRRQKKQKEETLPVAIVLLPLHDDVTLNDCYKCGESVDGVEGGLTADGRAVHEECLHDTPLVQELPLSKQCLSESVDGDSPSCLHCAKAIAPTDPHRMTKSGSFLHDHCSSAYVDALSVKSGILIVPTHPSKLLFQGSKARGRAASLRNGAVLTGDTNTIAWLVEYIHSIGDTGVKELLLAAGGTAGGDSGAMLEAVLKVLLAENGAEVAQVGDVAERLKALLQFTKRSDKDQLWISLAISIILRRMCAEQMVTTGKLCPIKDHAYACGVTHDVSTSSDPPPAKRSRGRQGCKCWKLLDVAAALDECAWVRTAGKLAILQVGALCQVLPQFAAFSGFGEITCRTKLAANAGRLLHAMELLRSCGSVCPDVTKALGGEVVVVTLAGDAMVVDDVAAEEHEAVI